MNELIRLRSATVDQFYKKQIERSDSLILGILGNLAHFSHLFIKLNQFVITKSLLKYICDKVELNNYGDQSQIGQ